MNASESADRQEITFHIHAIFKALLAFDRKAIRAAPPIAPIPGGTSWGEVE